VFVLICTVVVLNCFVMCVCGGGVVGVCMCMCGFCNVWVCMGGFCMCGCLDNVYTLNLFGYHDRDFSVLFPQL
jgi:hypothetical protein